MLSAIYNMLPIQSDSLKLTSLCNEYKDWYLFNLKQEYYSEYLDTKYNVNCEHNVNTYIQSIIDKDVSETKEIRLIFLENNTPIGGCSLSEIEKGLELAYFIVPQRQHRGYAYRMLTLLLNNIKALEYNNIYALVQIHNKASIKLLQKLRFIETSRIEGKTCTDIWYKWNPIKVRLKKYENIRILYNGKTKSMRCIFSDMMYGKIPIYTSENVSNIQVIRFKSDEILVLINKDFYSTLKRYNELHNNKILDISIMYSILTERYKENIRKDICLAYWFGFMRVIDLIQTDKLGKYLPDRVKRLENELSTSELSSTVPTLDTFLNNIDFIEVI